MSQFRPTNFPLLLEAFREGLKFGIISREEVIAWADEIIKGEYEPDYFFIEISLAGDINRLLEILNKNTEPQLNPLHLRVVLGLAYQRFVGDEINLEKLLGVCASINYESALSSFEESALFEIEYGDLRLLDEYPKDSRAHKWYFLNLYQDFNLHNSEEWPAINSRIEEIIDAEQAKISERYKRDRLAYEKSRAKIKLKKRIAIMVLIALVILTILLDIDAIKNDTFGKGLSEDHNQQWVVILNVYLVYWGGRLGYMFWKRANRKLRVR